MEAQFGIAHVWAQGDFVTRGVALCLLTMSIASWVVIVMKVLALLRLKRFARQSKDFWHSEDFRAGLNKLEADPRNPFRYMALEGYEAKMHHGNTQQHLHDVLDISDWMTRSLRYSMDEFSARMQAGLAILASVASTAPFVGLFGTVWGIYHALLAIGMSGQSSIDKVAGPIGEALIMTAFGLAVAIPAVLAYNGIVRGNKGVTNVLNSFAHDLHAYFVTGARVAGAEGAAGSNVMSIRRGA